MNRMTETRLLRSVPDGAVVGTANTLEIVEIIAVQGEWTQIRLVNVFTQPTGWVRSDAIEAVDDPIGPPASIDRRLFTRECWWRAIDFGVNPHYLVAYAELRSGTRNGRFTQPEEEFGPFRLTRSEWEAQAGNIAPGFAFPPASLGIWSDHVILIAATAAAVARGLGNIQIDAITLFLNQLLGPATAQALAGANGVLPQGVNAQDLTSRFGTLLAPQGALLTDNALRAHIEASLVPAFANTASLVRSVGVEVLDNPSKDGLDLSDPTKPLRKGSKKAVDDKFEAWAPGIMRRLIQDFGFSDFQAAGILGNIGHECRGFKSMQEINVSPGGYGWCQWSNTRRPLFEKYCQDIGVNIDDAIGNYGFMALELNTTHKTARNFVLGAGNFETAVRAFMDKFEVPAEATANEAARREWGRLALSRYRSILSQGGPVVPFP